MGKRAAAKPKASAGSAGAGAPKRQRAAGAAQLTAAPEHWARPPLPLTGLDSKPELQFFLVDVEDGPAPGTDGLEHEVRLYGITAEGHSLCARVRGVRPYFYIWCPAEAKGREEEIRARLAAALPREFHAECTAQAVVAVEVVPRTSVMGYQQERTYLKVVIAGPRVMGPCVRAVESGLQVSAAGGGSDLVISGSTFEANIPLVLRFLVDKDLGGGRWVRLAGGTYSVIAENRLTIAQVELGVHIDSLEAIPLDAEQGSAIPPVRVVALEAIALAEPGSKAGAGSEDALKAVACSLHVHGRRGLPARAVWLCQQPQPSTPGGEPEVADSKSVPKVFVSEAADALVDHLGRTLELLDADVLVVYGCFQVVRRLLGKKGVAKAGSALARGLTRRLTCEVKLTQKSSEVSGITGRLAFDLQRQVEKEHRLVDYSLGNLSDHFCQAPLPELREATLAELLAARPRALAQHALRRAEALMQIFDRLAYLFNFVEMARVTGCPLSYLLERGQAVKVQAQILREARRRCFILPSQRPGTGEESSFEGATVLEPACGFYRRPVSVLDFASLYPSIMMAHNLCYSTLLPSGAEKRPDAPDHAVAPAPEAARAGSESLSLPATVAFVRSGVQKGLLPSILEQLISARKAAKRELAACPPEEEMRRKVLHGRQLALKLSANSVYGFTGAVNGPLPCLELAGAVTAYGRAMIQATRSLIESTFTQKHGYAHDAQVIYGDTDSVMVCFGPDELPLKEVMRLSHEATKLCTAAFPAPICLEFEKVYHPYLLMNKKRYAGLAWTGVGAEPSIEMKGIETVRRDWSDLVRHGLERTLELLLRNDGDGVAEATAHVQGLCADLRQNKVDFRSLVISKSLGREDYAAKAPHSEVAARMRKRHPESAPSFGDRVSYLVLAGAAKSKVYERAEDPSYALENDLPIDAEYYLENQLKQPLIRVFELVLGSAEKAEQMLFGQGGGQRVAAASTMHGMGKFMKPKPKCLGCGVANVASEADAFCGPCAQKGPAYEAGVREAALARARSLRETLGALRASCAARCALPSGPFSELRADAPTPSVQNPLAETCANVNCQSVFRRVQCSKDLRSASGSLRRLKVADW